MKKIHSILLLSFLFFAGLYAQVDTEFWFAAPDLTADHSSQDAISLNFVSYENPAAITISQPANPAFTPVTVNLSANDFYNFSLRDYRTIVETIADGTVQNTGIHITSTSPVTAYYAAVSNNSEIYTFKGKNALGNEFTVPMQHSYNCAHNGYASVEIVATEDSTVVTFITRVPTNMSTQADTIKTPVLNRGQTYAIRASGANTLGRNHLHNTKVLSNKPVAVNTTDDSTTTGGDQDLVGEQLIPENLAASKYVVISNNSNHERAYISAIYENTVIYVDEGSGRVLVATLDPGDEFTYSLKKEYATVFSSEDAIPFILFQLTASSGELGGTILPNLDCSGSTEVSYKITLSSKIRTTVLTRIENTGSFTVNGSTRVITASMFNPVPGASEWAYAFAEITGTDAIRIKNTNGVFHLGIFDADGATCSYGYFSNYGSIPLQVSTDQGYYMEGENIVFSLYNGAALKNIQWTGPRGVFGVDNAAPVLTNVTIADAGMYVVSAEHEGACEVLPDTFYIHILKSEKEYLYICDGASVTLHANAKPDENGKYEWTPAGLPDTDEIRVTPAGSTFYTVKNYKTGFNRVRNGDFSINENSFLSDYTYGGAGSAALMSPGTYVVGDNPQNYHPDYGNVREHTGDNGFQLIVNCNAGEAVIWQQTVDNIMPDTRYELSAWFAAANAGLAPGIVRLKINNEVSAPFQITNDGSWNYAEFEWKNEGSTAVISVISDTDMVSGTSLCIDDIRFAPLLAVVDSFDVMLTDSLMPVIAGDKYLCRGMAVLEVEGEYDAYTWSGGETTKSIVVTAPGDYFVKVKSDECEGSARFTVLPAEAVEFTLGDVPVICSGDPDFTVSWAAVSGELGECKIVFDPEAVIAGFTGNIIVSENHIIIELPVDVRPDIYKAELVLTDEKCGEEVTFPLEFMVRYLADVLTQRWNDILAVKNSTYTRGEVFSHFQWYKNDAVVEGGNGSYLYEKDYFTANDSYSVLLTRSEDGVSIFICDFYPEILGDGGDIPTVVMPGQTVELKNINSAGTAVLWNKTGQIEFSQQLESQKPVITMPVKKGLYILTVNTEEQFKVYKILVR